MAWPDRDISDEWNVLWWGKLVPQNTPSLLSYLANTVYGSNLHFTPCNSYTTENTPLSEFSLTYRPRAKVNPAQMHVGLAKLSKYQYNAKYE